MEVGGITPRDATAELTIIIHQPLVFHLASKSLHRHSSSQHISVHMHPSAGYYPVQNQITASRWMQASRQVSLLISSLKLDGLCGG